MTKLLEEIKQRKAAISNIKQEFNCKKKQMKTKINKSGKEKFINSYEMYNNEQTRLGAETFERYFSSRPLTAIH